ncbi:response regulator [Ruminococcaceae bacterium OttesenSCG-928-L11]|nr:response regulator [Ruminococcaceae bacterium OttesenSCG-928-L11]
MHNFIGKLTIPRELRHTFQMDKLRTNTNRMYALSIYIIAIQVILNVINILKPSDSKSSDILIYIALSMITLAMGVIYCILFTFVRKGKIRGNRTRAFLVNSLLYLYIGIQMIFCTLNVIATGGINSYIIAILIIGLFPIISPVQSIASILSAFAYLWIILYATRDRSSAWDSILISDTWTNLIIITGLTICVSVFIYTMYVSNYMKSVELVQTNDNLEATVYDRTIELEAQTKAATVASAAKSNFLARMSHEIRTPLNAIIGMTQIALKSSDGEEINQSLGEIKTASSHLLDIVNDILDMSKIETGRFELDIEPFDISAVLKEIVNIITVRCAERGIAFRHNIDSLPSLFLVGDRLHLKQILINLLGNAVKFTDSYVEFTVEQSRDTNNSVALGFAIADDGIGIASDRIPSLFTPFEQGGTTISAQYGGTGLGLSISKNLAELMGGSITVDSEVGVGSAFHFRLTLAEADEAPLLHNESTDVPDLTGKRILIVEDIEINSLILSNLLADTHAAIEIALDGKQALDRVAASAENYYSLIFMDVQMPVMDGCEATSRIRKLERADARDIPIIAMTANAYKEDVVRCRNAGMNDHVAKPIDHTLIMKVLNQYL